MTDSVLTTGQQLESLWALGGLSWRELLKHVWGGINRNDLINRAYELAYNFLLAVFPMLFFLLGLLGMSKIDIASVNASEMRWTRSHDRL